MHSYLPNPSTLLVLSIFIFTFAQYEFFSLLILPSFFFLFPRRTFPILRVAACHAGLYFYFRLEFPPSLAAKSPSTIFPNFIRLAAMLTLARHFLAPFSPIKSRFEAGKDVCVCVCLCETSVRGSAPSNFVKKKTRYHESDT